MDEASRNQRNALKLGELFPAFRNHIATVITRLESVGIRPRIQDAWRSPEAQLIAFQSGHSKLKFGLHNVTAGDGTMESLAVDLLDDDHPLAQSSAYLLRVAAAAEAEGLTTGIRWGLPPKMASSIDSAIAAQDWEAAVKVGWDPTHIQSAGITASAARSGQRPT